MAGRLTIARAIASRWRWPPETLVPPWSIGASSWPGMAATKSRACAISSAPELRVSGALVAEAEVLRDRALEEIRSLRNEPDACPEPIERLLAHVEAVHKDDARRDVKAPRHEAHDRALSGAGPADDRRGPSWPRLERQAVQNGTLAVRVRERHVRERDEPRELLRRNRA